MRFALSGAFRQECTIFARCELDKGFSLWTACAASSALNRSKRLADIQLKMFSGIP